MSRSAPPPGSDESLSSLLLGSAPPSDDAASTHSKHPASEGSSSPHNLIATLHVLNVHVQHLWARLDAIRSGIVALEQSGGLINQTIKLIRPLIGVLNVDSDLLPTHSDSIARITNAWHTIIASPVITPPSGTTIEAQEQLKQIALLEIECRSIIYWSSYIPAPERIAEWLNELRPGYAILFHDIFKDEIPFIDDRQKLLGVLANAPQLIAKSGGLIDGETGVIYRYEIDSRKRWRSVGWVGLALVAATSLIALAGLYLPLAGTNGPGLLVQGWFAALVGIVIHLGVTTVKRLRNAGASAMVLPVDRFSIDINAKLGVILLRIGMLFVAYLGLMAGGLLASNAGNLAGFLFSALLAGYSLDSVVDLLSASLDQQAAAQFSGLKSQPRI
ncbi:MAG: hypothetical protein WCP31_04580 [Chloroflexales bacterium]